MCVSKGSEMFTSKQFTYMTETLTIKMSINSILGRVVSTFLDILTLNRTEDNVNLLDMLTEFIKLFIFSHCC